MARVIPATLGGRGRFAPLAPQGISDQPARHARTACLAVVWTDFLEMAHVCVILAGSPTPPDRVLSVGQASVVQLARPAQSTAPAALTRHRALCVTVAFFCTNKAACLCALSRITALDRFACHVIPTVPLAWDPQAPIALSAPRSGMCHSLPAPTLTLGSAFASRALTSIRTTPMSISSVSVGLVMSRVSPASAQLVHPRSA